MAELLADPALVPALLVGAGGAALTRALRHPPPRLAPRLRPYNSANRARLGRGTDLDRPLATPGTLNVLFGPMLRSAGAVLSRLLDRESDEALLLRLRQAGALQHVPTDERLQAYRTRRMIRGGATLVAFCVPGLALQSTALLLVGLLCGTVFGASLPRARLDREITERRERMRVELYTVNQQLAMYQASAGGIDEALTRLVSRGRGLVVGELAEALRWRRAGLPLAQALQRLADLTAEDHAARTYRALARAAETGASMQQALLHLSEDVRASRRDALERLATKRRATMLVPIVVLLVPPLLLLVSAPVAFELFGLSLQ